MSKYRDYKIFAPGHYYHIFNRGVAKQDIFYDDEDRKLLLFRLKEQISGQPLSKPRPRAYIRKVFPPNLFEIVSYCLMPNHFHFLIKQLTDIKISELFQRVVSGYSKVFNTRHNRVGSVFQDQYKAVDVRSDEQLAWLSAYIHKNPVKAGLVKKPEDWIWSSYQDFINLRKGSLVNTFPVLSLPWFNNKPEIYKKFVDSTDNEQKAIDEIKHIMLDPE